MLFRSPLSSFIAFLLCHCLPSRFLREGVCSKHWIAMAKVFALFLLALLAISMLHTTVLASHGHGGHHYDQKNYGPGSLKSFQCPSQCSRRCGKTQYHKPCMFFCQKCCKKCLCVPPGYYGNKAVCPCYNNWKTKEGGPKCP